MPGINLGNHGLEAGTVEIRSTVSIIRKMLDVVKAVFASVIFQILFSDSECCWIHLAVHHLWKAFCTVP